MKRESRERREFLGGISLERRRGREGRNEGENSREIEGSNLKSFLLLNLIGRLDFLFVEEDGEGEK